MKIMPENLIKKKEEEEGFRHFLVVKKIRNVFLHFMPFAVRIRYVAYYQLFPAGKTIPQNRPGNFNWKIHHGRV